MNLRCANPLFLGILLVSLLAGCGDGKDEEPVVPAPPVEPEPDPVRPDPDLPKFLTARQCGECHEEIYREWSESMHGRAMDDPLFLDLAPENKEECIRCHAPVPLREVDFETPIARADRREDAISCLSCHQTATGVAGPFGGLSGACRPVEDPDQRNPVKMCFGCHNQHDTGTEWLDGPYGPRATEPRRRPETSCLDCHMPEVERPLVKGGVPRKGRRHTWPGGHDMSQLRKAAEVEVEVESLPGGGFRFRTFVTNVGAGHQIPTDARHRSFDTYLRIEESDGRVLVDPLKPADQARARTATYRKFYRNSGRKDTQIPPLERVSAMPGERGHLDLPEARSGRGEVWLVYRLTPRDALVPESLTDPVAVPYRARVVIRKEFSYGP
jgi:hypothetical protein